MFYKWTAGKDGNRQTNSEAPGGKFNYIRSINTGTGTVFQCQTA